jgi:hypothetical protein
VRQQRDRPKPGAGLAARLAHAGSESAPSAPPLHIAALPPLLLHLELHFSFLREKISAK